VLKLKKKSGAKGLWNPIQINVKGVLNVRRETGRHSGTSTALPERQSKKAWSK